MNEEIRATKSNLGYSWVQSASSGATYLCPAGSAGSLRSASDEELRRVCVDESNNPQND